MLKPNLRLPPEFIEPANILAMDDTDLEKLVSAIRERRMLVLGIYLQAQEEKKRVNNERISIKMEKVCGYIVKEIEKVDERFAKLEERVNQLRALRLEAEID